MSDYWQRTKINKSLSSSFAILKEGPQRSVLGLTLFHIPVLGPIIFKFI